MATGDRVIASAHNGLNAYLLSCNIVKYLCPLAIGGKGLLADKTAYLTDNITEKSSQLSGAREHPSTVPLRSLRCSTWASSNPCKPHKEIKQDQSRLESKEISGSAQLNMSALFSSVKNG